MVDRLPDKLDSNARVEVRVNGVTVGTRRIIDILGGVTGSDDGVNDKVTVSFAGGGTGVGYWKVDPTGSFGDPALVIDLVATGTIAETFLSPRDDPSNGIDIYDNGGTSPGIDTFINANTAGDWNQLVGRDWNLDAGRDFNLGADEDVNISAGRDLNLQGVHAINFSPSLDSLLADTGVTPGTYGTSVKIPRFTVDAKGRISSVTELPVPSSGAGDLWQVDGTNTINLIPNAAIEEVDIFPAGGSSGTGGAINVVADPHGWVGIQGGDAGLQFMASGTFQYVGTGGGLDFGNIDGPVLIGSNDDNITLSPGTGQYIIVTGLPTSDPGVSGALYTVAGILHVSP